MLPWTESHRPKTLSQVRGQELAIRQLRSFVERFSPKRPKGALLHGPSGSGKTCSVHALGAELKLEVLEVSSADARDKSRLEPLLDRALGQRSLLAQGKIVLVDDVDCFSGKDRGAAQAVLAAISKSAFPVILTAVDPWDKKLSALRRKCELIEFAAPQPSVVAGLLRDIAADEGARAEPLALEMLAQRAGGDVRAAVCDLQVLSSLGEVKQEHVTLLDPRGKTESLESVLPRIFRSSDANVAFAALDGVEEDLDEALLWIEENLPEEYRSPADLSRAMGALSLADVFRGRIVRRQHWRLQLYVRLLLTAGVALAKETRPKGAIRYRRPGRILSIWMAKRFNAYRDSVCGRIAELTHCSAREARLAVLPLFLAASQRAPEAAAAIEGALGLTPEERGWLETFKKAQESPG
ncbi:replication factor C large subunit [Candidatus Woesearchaeota archaeon]|nr:replication factor C large subunit [Candidatus Woesearchaeota archaeon]